MMLTTTQGPRRRRAAVAAAAAALVMFLAASGPARPANPKPPKEPAKIRVTVDPAPAGGTARVVLSLEPIEGVKINRYPQVKLEVPGQQGLVAEGRATLGDAVPPPPDKAGKNYFERVEPVRLALEIDPSAPAGRHEVDGRLSYFYCMPASGFCAPVKIPVSLPLQVD